MPKTEGGKLPEKVRVSVGSAIVLELMGGSLDAAPTTAYLLTYRNGKCAANCGFCPQAKTSKGRADMLSRVTWPPFPTANVIPEIGKTAKKGLIKRVCIQALNYPNVFEHVLQLVKAIRSRTDVPISVSSQPLSRETMQKLANAGVERIGIPIDAATKEIFNRVKGHLANGPYVWEKQREALVEAVEIFGEKRVSTHLIVGLGETEREMVEAIQWCVDIDVYPGLFAFTPISGTALGKCAPPTLSQYRRIQIAHYLVTNSIVRFEDTKFDGDGCLTDFGVPKEQLLKIVRTGKPFLTSGCLNCNRPYYNEKPGGPIYNYPRQPTSREISEIVKQAGLEALDLIIERAF